MKLSVKYYLLTFLLFLVFNELSYAQINIDSVITEIMKLKDDTSKVSKINNFIWEIKSLNPDTAIYLGVQNIELAEKLDFYDGMGYAAKNIGGTYYYLGDYDNALIYYQLSKENFEKAENKLGIAISYKNIGNIYSQLGDWKNALDYFLKSLAMREDLDDKKGIALVSNSIGVLYINSNSKEIDSALKYFEKALKINLELENKSGVAESYLYIGSFYFSRNDFVKFENDSLRKISDTLNNNLSLENLIKCRNICIDIEDLRTLATCDEIIGQIYLFQKKYDESFKYLGNSLSIREALGNQFGIATSYNNLTAYYLKIEDYDLAEEYCMKAYNLSNEIGALAILNTSYEYFFKIYEQKKDFEKAYNYLYKYYELKDSLQSEENFQQMTQLSMQYEFDKKQKLQEIEQEAKLKKQRILTYSFVGGFIFMIIFAVFIFKSYRNKQKANNLLKEKNNEITSKNAILSQQKEEIEAQRDEILQQKDIVVKQHDKIAKQNKHITDSIVYAQRIQDAILPPKDYLETILNEYFVVFKPRDIVSGDFYWATKREDYAVVTAADCTGHGVPGAFMSMLGVSFLNEIVNTLDVTDKEEFKASVIIDHLKESIMKSLRQTGKDNEAKDGMDMSLIVLNLKKSEGQFAGAHNPLILIRNNELIEFKADRMPVGISYRQDEPFVNNIFEIYKNDIFYMFSDGPVDQFGGPEGRKYTSRKFKNLLLSISKFSFNEQKEILNKEIEEWKAHKKEDGEKYDQTDDIIIFGIKI